MTVTSNTWNLLDWQRVDVTCPHCGMIFAVNAKAGAQIVLCDTDYGSENASFGCGKEFVVKLPFDAQIRVKSFKIEGE